eukprot:COSAG03_NODE_4447_length_1550_cov_1.287388_1_plen_241_part_10
MEHPSPAPAPGAVDDSTVDVRTVPEGDPPNNEVESWTVEQVRRWVAALDVAEQAASLFEKERIRGRDLLELTEAELEIDIGVATLGDRKAILRAISSLGKRVGSEGGELGHVVHELTESVAVLRAQQQAAACDLAEIKDALALVMQATTHVAVQGAIPSNNSSNGTIVSAEPAPEPAPQIDSLQSLATAAGTTEMNLLEFDSSELKQLCTELSVSVVSTKKIFAEISECKARQVVEVQLKS